MNTTKNNGEKTMGAALALIENLTPEQAFQPDGLTPVIEKIRAEVTGRVLDISSDKGRKEIASLAFNVGKSKNAIDKMGKDLVSGIKAQAKVIDAERSRVWDALEALQHETRRPLTEWEDKDKDRIAAHEADIAEINGISQIALTSSSAEIEEKIQSLARWHNKDWEEFAARAGQAQEKTLAALTERLATTKQAEADRVELERLRQERIEREKKEHEDRLQREAADKARLETEAKNKEQSDRQEREKREAQERTDKAERERIASENREKEAKAALKTQEEQAKRDKEASEKRHQQELADERERMQKKADQEKETERLRLQKIEDDAAEEKRQREANQAHRAKINKAALAAISAITGEDIDEKQSSARAIVAAIAKGEVPHISIAY